MSCEEEQMRGSLAWLEQLRELVNRQGLAPQYLERLFEELSDHFQDIQEEKKRMDAEQVCTPDARMGEPAELARFVGSEYRKRCFSQKHPVVMFAVMPVLLLLGIWSGLGLLAYGIESMFEEPAESVASSLTEAAEPVASSLTEAAEPAASSLTEELICCGLIWLPVALTAVIFCRSTLRRGVSWRWSMLTAATLAVFPGMTVRLSPSMLTIGLHTALPVTALIQLMLPLAIGSWYSWRGFRLLKA
jgi:hypothetical protein